MEALDNKCPACGAKIDFNPINQKWDCIYCGSSFSLDEIQKCNNPNIVDTNEKNVIGAEHNNEMDVYCCKNCGAEIMADETTVATFCVYCGSTAILKDKINASKIPNFIIPFQNEKKDAIEAFKNLTKHKPLAPRCFKSSKNIEKVMGVYIPFWAYDLEASGTVEFIGKDYKHWRDEEYYYTKTSKYEVKKSGKFDFSKVLADASSKFSDDLMDSLEPFDYKQLTEYNHAYLAGFLADKYDISEEKGLERVSGRTNDTAVDLIKSTVNHESVEVNNNQISVRQKRVYYLLIPVWMVSIRYKEKNYIFAMNGQTGKIVGDIPIGIKEFVIWSISIFIVLFILTFLGLMFI